MAGNKLQDDINNIPLADDDPQGKRCPSLIFFMMHLPFHSDN